MNRRKTTQIKVGNIYIGSEHDVVIQSMNNTKTEDIDATIKQLLQLEKAGCQMGRITIPTMEAAKAVKEIKKEINIPIVGDIHFDYKMALAAVENGIDKIRINPGNIGGKEKTRAVIEACKKAAIPIRIGVNSGSLEREIVNKYHGVTADGMVESMLKFVDYFREENFDQLILSLKASDVMLMVEAYRKIKDKCNFPLHLGVTEAGSYRTGTIKSSVGLGILLAEGIGDTIRVSLTGDVDQEIFVAKEILKALKLRSGGINIISCPTCGRTNLDLAGIVDDVENRLEKLDIKTNLNVAIMGCAVNGPGEAKEADIGLAGGKGEAIIFEKGKIIRKVDESIAADTLIEEIQKLAATRQ